MAFVDGLVRVSVPATSANLGPGFDSLGLALDLHDELTGEVVGADLVVDIEGEGADSLPLDESHLVVSSMRAAFDALGESPSGLRLHCHNVIPHARGLGSSSAAIVGGLGLARALVVDGSARLPDADLFALAAGIEGHPDNVAPACFGGLVICGREDEDWYAVRAPLDPRLGAVVLVPPTPVSTELARGLLPATVPHADAAADAGRSALLIAALGGAPERLFLGTRDYLHQHYRRAAMPESVDLVDRLRADGVPAVISGAGPTVLAFVADGVAGLPAAEGVVSRCPEGWRPLVLSVDVTGVRVSG